MTSEHNGTHPAILVVEDDQLVRFTAAALLEAHGYDVVGAGTAEAAFDVLTTRSDVALLFTDVSMPGAQDGIGLVRNVHERWPHIALLVASGKLSPGPGTLPATASFLQKPYRAEALFREVEALLSEQQPA